LPQVRKRLQQILIRLGGICPYCHTRFPKFDSS
jgi:hypothetical protein